MVFSGQITTRPYVSGFIPNVWAGEIRRMRDKKFAMSMACRRRSFIGQKGDTYTEPLVGRAAVYPKIEGQPVVLQARTPGNYQVKIDQHNESSFAISDLARLQSQYELRGIYTREAGYALRRDLNNSVLALRAAIPLDQQIFVTSDGTAAGIPQAINDAAILAGKQYLDEIDVPEEDRVILVSPGQYSDLLAIDKFISRDYVNNAPVVTGVIGSLYGYPVLSMSEIKINSLDGYINGDGAVPQPTPGVLGSPYMPTQDAVVGSGLPRGQTGSETTNPFVSAMMCHRGWATVLVQYNITTESQRLTTYLADAVVTSHAFAAKLYRSTEAVLFHTRP